MDNTIRFRTFENVPAYVDVTVRTLRPDLPKWSQRLFVWLGDKLGVFKKDFERSVSYEEHQLDFNLIVQDVAKHECNLEMIASQRGKYLIVGRNQMDKFRLHDFAARNLGTHLTPPFGMQYMERGERKTRIFHHELEVIFVPYIDGAFILPDIL